MLRRVAEENSFELQQCIYSEGRQEKLDYEVIDQIIEEWRIDPVD